MLYYNQATQTKKRAAAMLFLMLGVMLVLLSSAHNPAKAYDLETAVIISDTCPLYESPSENAAIIGTYYSAVFLQGEKAGNDWFHTVLPENVTEPQPNFSGYMRMSDIMLYDVLMERKTMPYYCPVGEVTEDTGFLEAPDASSKVIAHTLRGTVVEILGTRSDWLHARMGSVVGFLPITHVKYTGEMSHLYDGPPPRGYLVRQANSNGYTEGIQVYPFPNVPYLPTAAYDQWSSTKSMAMYAQLGDWLQIRERVGGRITGFIKDSGNIYWRKDMEVSNVRLGQGKYTVGQELPAGLYTFSAPGGNGRFESTGNSPLFYHLYESNGEPYSMYLSDGVAVSITGDGLLVPMDQTNVLTEANDWLYSAGGRFMIGENIKHPQGMNYVVVRLNPGETAGYYATSTLDDEAGIGERPRRTRVLPDMEGYLGEGEAMIYVEPGTFLEVKNCTIRFDFGNG